jgi:hypothetical protein
MNEVALQLLPPELMQLIAFKYLDAASVGRLKQVCRHTRITLHNDEFARNKHYALAGHHWCITNELWTAARLAMTELHHYSFDLIKTVFEKKLTQNAEWVALTIHIAKCPSRKLCKLALNCRSSVLTVALHMKLWDVARILLSKWRRTLPKDIHFSSCGPIDVVAAVWNLYDGPMDQLRPIALFFGALHGRRHDVLRFLFDRFAPVDQIGHKKSTFYAARHCELADFQVVIELIHQNLDPAIVPELMVEIASFIAQLERAKPEILGWMFETQPFPEGAVITMPHNSITNPMVRAFMDGR